MKYVSYFRQENMIFLTSHVKHMADQVWMVPPAPGVWDV